MRRVCQLASLLVLALSAGRPIAGQERLDSANWPVGVAARSALPTQRAYNYEFRDVQVSELEGWLKWLGYEFPAKISGQVTGWLWAQRSSSGWFDLAGYRLEGEVESPQLLIESWRVEQARVRFGYAEGSWYVGKLSGEIAEQTSDASIGRVELQGKLPLAGPRALQISGSLNQVLLQPLLTAFGLRVAIDNQPGNLVLRSQVPLSTIGDISTWTVRSELDIAGVVFTDAPHLPELSITGPLQLEAGHWNFSNAQIGVAQQTLQGNAQGELAAGPSGTLRDARLPYSATISSARLDLEKLLASLGRNRGIPAVQGIVSLAGEFSGNAAEGLEAAALTLQAPQIKAVGETLAEVELQASLQMSDGMPQGLNLNLQSARVAAGNISGQLTWLDLTEMAQGLPSSADLMIEHVDLSRLSPSQIPVGLAGTADGQLRLRSEPQQQPAAWTGELRLRVRQFAVSKTNLGDVYLSVSKTTAESLELQLRDALKSFSLQALLAAEPPSGKSNAPYQFSSYSLTGELHNYQTRLALAAQMGPHFTEVPVAASGSFQLEGKLPNGLDELANHLPERGRVVLDDLRIGLGRQMLHLQDSLLNIRPDAWRLEQFRLVSQSAQDASNLATLEQGRVVGSALIRRDGQGVHLLNLRVTDLQLADFVREYAPPELHGLTGQVLVEMRLQKSAASATWPSGWSGQLAGQVRDASFREIPLTDLAFDGSLQPEQLSLRIDGSLLGGELDAKLDLTPRQIESLLLGEPWMQGQQTQETLAEAAEAEGSASRVEASLKGMELKRLMSIIFGPHWGSKYAGTTNLNFNASYATLGTPLFDASLEIPSFLFERHSLAQRLRGVVRYQDGRLSIEKFDGGIAGGRMEVVGSLRESRPGRYSGDLRFDLESLQLPALAAWVAPEMAEQLVGTLNYQGRALLGREILLSGAARIRDAMAYQLPIQDLRSQLRILLAYNGRLHELSARNIHGTALGGLVDGEAQLHGDSGYQLSSAIQISNGKLEQLSRALGFEYIVGTGCFDAQATLRSSDAMNLSALSGPLQIDFEGGDAQSVPLLSDLGRLLPLLQLGSTDISTGRLNAQLGQGQLRISNVFLSGDAFWLVGDGSASLTTGGLDIKALVNTGGGLDTQLAQSASQKLVAIALPQLALLGELNDLVRNRTLYLHIGGSTSHPVIQPQVAPTLARALLQNVSRRLLVVPTATANQN